MASSQPIDTGIEERFAELQVRVAAMSFPHALAVGDRAADFELPNAQGHRVHLADQLDRGAVVFIFYAGAWCPSLLAISPELPDGSPTMVEQAALTFEVLSDLHSTVAAAYRITFTLTPTEQALFLEVGNDLGKANGDTGWVLPAPATFVIAGAGTIQHTRVDADYTCRITADKILSALRTITT